MTGPEGAPAKQFCPCPRLSRGNRVPAMHARRCRCHPPAQSRSGKVREPVAPQQVERHAMPFGGEHQPPRGGEIERLGIARKLSDDEGQRAAPYALLHRPQRIGGVARRDMDEPAAPRDRQAMEERASAAANALRILHPQPGFRRFIALPPAFGERQRQRFAGGIVHARKQLPQAGRQDTLGRPIGTLPRPRGRQVRRAQRSEAIGGRVIGGRRKMIGIGHSGATNRLALMFPLCSHRSPSQARSQFALFQHIFAPRTPTADGAACSRAANQGHRGCDHLRQRSVIF